MWGAMIRDSQNYATFPDAPSAESFKAFEHDPLTLFLEDQPRIHE
jgi:hypothetical protein